jgi:hypothetical protein
MAAYRKRGGAGRREVDNALPCFYFVTSLKTLKIEE